MANKDIQILTLDDWHDSALLNSRWVLETVAIDTTEKLWLQVHGIEGVNGLVIVGLELSCCPFVSPCPNLILRCDVKDRMILPSGISSRPLSVEAIFAIGGIENLDHKLSFKSRDAMSLLVKVKNS